MSPDWHCTARERRVIERTGGDKLVIGQDIEPSLSSIRDSIVSNEISVHEDVKKPSEAVSSWPDGDYCILPGRAFKCPEGFYMGSISLAVPMSFGTREVSALTRASDHLKVTESINYSDRVSVGDSIVSQGRDNSAQQNNRFDYPFTT
ncbi:unnamed protein product [Haemonchus placei]|uniref:dUTPase domain-containing protein n=1 Tax=Haemonchus placei TaxID=6290 RepID=A0A0N4WA09_HAEPC|nr:unnamed protein product [Haemonchus placei]